MYLALVGCVTNQSGVVLLQNRNNEDGELKRILECLLFVAGEPLTLDKLIKLSGQEKALVEPLMRELEEDYRGRGVVLRRIAGGWQFSSAPQYAEYIERLYRPRLQQLSKASLETLAIIAYRQPITRQDMENIRQVNVDGVVTNLLEKNLIREVGRREGAGRPILYGTTSEFLSFFGLESLAQLPPWAELSAPAEEENL